MNSKNDRRPCINCNKLCWGKICRPCNANRDKKAKKKRFKICKNCGARFKAKRYNARFCKRSCGSLFLQKKHIKAGILLIKGLSCICIQDTPVRHIVNVSCTGKIYEDIILR